MRNGHDTNRSIAAPPPTAQSGAGRTRSRAHPRTIAPSTTSLRSRPRSHPRPRSRPRPCARSALAPALVLAPAHAHAHAPPPNPSLPPSPPLPPSSVCTLPALAPALAPALVLAPAQCARSSAQCARSSALAIGPRQARRARVGGGAHRLMPKRLWSGARAMRAIAVVQFGLATTRLFDLRAASALISGTTSGTSSS